MFKLSIFEGYLFSVLPEKSDSLIDLTTAKTWIKGFLDMIEKDKRAAATINGQNDSENKRFIFFELANSLMMCFEGEYFSLRWMKQML